MLMPYQMIRLALPASIGLGMLIGSATAAMPQIANHVATSPASASPGLHLVVGANGNEVRYRVRERLVGITLPYEAIGRTNEVTGSIVLDSLGAVVPGKSNFVLCGRREFFHACIEA